jgi:hypothetical protein
MDLTSVVFVKLILESVYFFFNNPVLWNYQKSVTWYWPSEITPWNKVILEKLIVAQLFKKFPVFYGTRKFITVFTLDLITNHHRPLELTCWNVNSLPVLCCTTNRYVLF